MFFARALVVAALLATVTACGGGSEPETAKATAVLGSTIDEPPDPGFAAGDVDVAVAVDGEQGVDGDEPVGVPVLDIDEDEPLFDTTDSPIPAHERATSTEPGWGGAAIEIEREVVAVNWAALETTP